jgi:hypothetical protein
MAGSGRSVDPRIGAGSHPGVTVLVAAARNLHPIAGQRSFGHRRREPPMHAQLATGGVNAFAGRHIWFLPLSKRIYLVAGLALLADWAEHASFPNPHPNGFVGIHLSGASACIAAAARRDVRLWDAPSRFGGQP